ncbi:MAG: hypothetical protein K1X36_05840 [Pyrinomonadaceae bacterium]|nr:hypothetical protein [Pyrinomonadaceae bacterium]
MAYGPLALSRRHVLGEYYSRCEAIESVPVYLNDPAGEVIGHVDESMGKYADAFLFHLSEDMCKKLSAGHYTYSFEFENIDPGSSAAGRRFRLLAVMLTARKGYTRPLPKRGEAALADNADAPGNVGESDGQ